MTPEPCPFCRSVRVVPAIAMLDTGDASAGSLTGRVGVEGGNAKWSFWDGHGGKIIDVTFRADVCCDCGRGVLRVEDPAALWEHFRRIPPDPASLSRGAPGVGGIGPLLSR